MALPGKGTTSIKNGTIILPCSCNHEFQDRRYGKGKRVHNQGAKTTCTVCGVKK